MSNTEWKKVKLGDIIVKLGKTEHPAKDALDSGKYPFFTNSASEKKFYINDFDFDEPIILANTGGKAYFKYCDVKCSASRDLYIFKTVPDVNVKYLYYVLKDMEQDINDNGFAGAALKHLNKDYLHSREISLPPLEEQRRIASLLSRFDELIQLHEFKADNLIKAKQQIMSDIFSGGLREIESINPDDYVQDNWATVKLGDVTNLLDRLRKPISKGDRISGEYPYYGANGIQDYVNDYIFDGRYILVGEDGSVITKDNTPVVNWGTGKFWANNHVHILEAKDGFDMDFIFYAISNVDISGYVHGNIPKYTKGDLVDTQVKIPPTIEEQQKIANLLSSYDSLIELKRSQKQQVTNMKQQLMSQLLTNGGGQSSWVTVKLGDIFGSISDKNHPEYDVLTVRSGYGTVLRSESGIDIKYKVESLPTYKLVRKGDFIIHLMSHECGLDIALHDGLISPAYNVIRCKDTSRVLCEYMKNVFHTKEFIQSIAVYATGLRVGKNIKWKDIQSIELSIPPIEEQHRIASVLSTFDSLSVQIDTEISNISSQKQAIMDKIFG